MGLGNRCASDNNEKRKRKYAQRSRRDYCVPTRTRKLIVCVSPHETSSCSVSVKFQTFKSDIRRYANTLIESIQHVVANNGHI